MVEEMEDLASPVGQFLRECCIVDATLMTPIAQLFWH
jgi:hypothetical protein